MAEQTNSSRLSPTGRPSAKIVRNVLRRRLRSRIRALLRKQGFTVEDDKIVRSSYGKRRIRAIHKVFRTERLTAERAFVENWFPRVSKYFAAGSEIEPCRVDPYPVLVEDNEEHAALFRIACLWWSIPVSRGFGRRFRILIFDRSNGKLFGLLALTDPVFNLNARDSWIGWNVRMRENSLAHVMDAHVLVQFHHTTSCWEQNSSLYWQQATSSGIFSSADIATFGPLF